jgi:hypothetical protein
MYLILLVLHGWRVVLQPLFWINGNAHKQWIRGFFWLFLVSVCSSSVSRGSVAELNRRVVDTARKDWGISINRLLGGSFWSGGTAVEPGGELGIN